MRSLAHAALLSLLAACGASKNELPTARVLITVDGVRADRLVPAAEVGADEQAGLGGLMETALSYPGVVASSVDPLAALVSLHTGLPAREHGVVSMRHPIRNRVPSSVELLAEAYSRAGSDTLAAVVGLGAPSAASTQGQASRVDPHHGLQRGFAQHAFGLASNGEAIDTAQRGLEEAAQHGRALFVWIHLTLADSPSSASWERSTKHHLASFAASDKVLAEALEAGDWRAMESHLGRRRGTAAWAALQRARYDAALLDLGTELSRLRIELGRYEQAEPGWLALIGVRGEALDELSLPPQHRVAPSRVRVPFLWSQLGVRAGLAAHSNELLVPAWEASRSFRPRPSRDPNEAPEFTGVPWVSVHTAEPGARAVVGALERWVQVGAGKPIGMAHGEDIALADDLPALVQERLAAPTVSARFDGGRVELRSLSQPGKGQGARKAEGEHTLRLLEPDEAFRIDLTFASEGTDADVHCTGYGRLDRLPLLRLPDRTASEWPEEEQPTVDVTRDSGARIRVKVNSTDIAKLHVRPLQPRPRRNWQARSHADESAFFKANDALGEAFFEGASLDVSWVAAKTPALAVTIGGNVVPSERIRVFGRRFNGETRSFLWTPGLLGHTTEGPGSTGSPDGAGGARFELSLDLPESAPRPELELASSVLPAAE